MKKCNPECVPLCDFCTNFKEVNYNDLKETYSDGICKITSEEVSRIDYCEENFHCFRYKEEIDNKCK